MSHPFEEWDEAKMTVYFRILAQMIKGYLPPETGFFMVCAPFGAGGVAQFVGNCQREDSIKWMRETLQRMSGRDTVERVVTHDSISVFHFHAAPKWMQDLSRHGGDEDWIAYVPAGYKGDCEPTWLDGLGCCEVSKHVQDDGSIVYIGAHA